MMHKCATGSGNVLIVDDDPSAVKVLSAILKESGYDVYGSHNVDRAIEIMQNQSVEAIITDLRMPGKDGYQFFEYVSEHYYGIPVIFLTAYGTIDSAVNAITNGAFYYFIKPPDYMKLKLILRKAIEQYRVKRELDILSEESSNGQKTKHIIGKTPPMTTIYKTIDSIKDSESSILIAGETGTGKELIARKIHYGSNRSGKPFIAFNCAAIPSELIESELFGSEKGAFTGAASRRIGKFEEADGGSVFLDEIGELNRALQTKLLRVLQEKEIERLGSNKKIRVNFRLITSTNRNLTDEIQSGNFREDLFYRINVVQIIVPPLRDRREDIPLLASEFLKEFCLRENKVLNLSDGIVEAFLNYTWPGNVRQLRNVIERMVVLSRNRTLTVNELPEELFPHYRNETMPSQIRSLKQMELHALRDALQACNGNKSLAARQLGISRKTLYKMLKESDIM